MSIDKQELVRRVSQRVVKGTDTVEEILDATLEEIYSSLKQGESAGIIHSRSKNSLSMSWARNR